MESHGTLHWLRHKDGPSRVLEATPGVRARLPRPFGEGRIAYVADHDGVEALYLRAIAGNPDFGPRSSQPSARSPVDSRQLRRSSSRHAAAGFRRRHAPAQARLGRSPHPAGRRGRSPGGTRGRNGPPPREHSRQPTQPTPPARRKATRLAQQGPSRQLTRIDFPKPTRASAIEASPDGNWLAVGTAFGDIYLVDTRTGTLSLVSSIGEGSIEGFSWSPDSAWLGWSEPVTSFGSRSRLRITSGGQRRPRSGREAHHHRGHRRTLPRRIAVVHPRRQVPRVPLQPQLRPGLRRALLRPVLPEPDQALPRGPRRGHAVALRPER